MLDRDVEKIELDKKYFQKIVYQFYLHFFFNYLRF